MAPLAWQGAAVYCPPEPNVGWSHVQTLRLASSLVLVTLALSAWASPPARVSVDDLRPGQTGYGLTVFQGTEPDTFGVTILGVQRGLRVGGDVILAELSGHGLETSAVAQGMSGSPIYLDDGRLVGAVAFGWAGALRPVAGITPVAELDRVRDRRDTDALASSSHPDPAPATPLDAAAMLNTPKGSRLAAALLPGQSHERPGQPSQPAWPRPEDLARTMLAAVPDPSDGTTQPLPMSLFALPTGLAADASSAPAAAPTTLVPGGACAVSLVTGDAQLGAIGTVSLVEGRRMVCMAHPFMQFGPVDLPLSTASVITLFPSREMSFKIGSAGVPVGRITHDLRAGLAGTLGETALTIPVDVALDSPQGRRSYHFDVARNVMLTPQMVFWCLYNALLAEGDDRSQQLVSYTMDLDLTTADGEPLPPVNLSGVTGGPGGVASLAADWQAPLQLLLQNRHEPLTITAVRAGLSVQRPRRDLVITGVRAPNRLMPGQSFTVEVELSPRFGPPVRERFELTAPSSLPSGPMRLGIGSAREFFAFDTVRAQGLFADSGLDAMIDLLNRPRSAGDLVVALVSPERGYTAAGRELDQLPGSVRSTLRSGPPGTLERTQASYLLRASRSLDAMVRGTAVHDVICMPQPPIHTEGDRP